MAPWREKRPKSPMKDSPHLGIGTDCSHPELRGRILSFLSVIDGESTVLADGL